MPEEGVQLTPKSKILTPDEIFEIAKVFVGLGVKKIRLTGGEPLLRRDIGEIFRKLNELNIELTLTTNGILVDRHVALFKEIGVKSLNISLDTLDKQRFVEVAKRDQFQRVVDNIKLLQAEGIHTKINAVIIRGFNDDELLDFVNWTRDTGVHVRFIEFMPFDGNRWNWNEIVSAKEILERISSVYEIIKLKDKKHYTARAYKVDGFKGTFAVISSMTDHFCAGCNRLRLTADGKMKNCLFSNNEVDLLTPFRKGDPIDKLVRSCLMSKKFKHGGIEKLSELKDSDMSDRSMILIGG